MRNIKTSLRFVRNSALLFVAASGMSYLTACQSEQAIEPTPENPNVPETPLSKVPYSVYGANQSRVRNYGASNTRAGEYVEATETFTMPESVAIPEGAKDLNAIDKIQHEGWVEEKPNLNYGSPVAGTYVINKDDTTDSGLDFTTGPVNIYVAGTLNASYLKGNGTVYVLPGGTLNYASEWMSSEPGVTIYNYGTIKGKNVCFAGKLYSAVDITEAVNFGVNEGAELFSKGSIIASEVRLNGDAVACAFIADKIDIHSVGTIKTSYFKSDNLTLNTGNVVLDNNGLVDVKNLFVSNADTRFTVNGTNAVVYAEKYETNNITWPAGHFGEGIACKFDESAIGGAKVAFNELGLQYSSESQLAFVPAAGCHGSFDYNGGDIKRDETDPEPPVTPDEPIVEIRKVTDIESLDEEINHGDHDHGIISATCITFGADGTAYASYHLRGAGTGDHNQPNYVGEYAQKGCIEVIKDNGEAGMELGSYMIAPDWDFNHLIVDGNRIVTVGNAKKMGAFIGALPVDFEASNGTDRDDFQVKELTTDVPKYGEESIDRPGEFQKVGYENAGDGNCVVRQGNYYYVATYEGYGPINLDFSRVKNAAGDVVFKNTNGSAKHISINGGNMAVIALDSYDKTSSAASVYKFGASDYTFADVLASYNVGIVEPVDGKNVIAVDGDEVYACLSKGGLVRVSDGTTWQRGENKNVPVNGMAFDDQYIYVANGSFVSVLDKATMEEICYYHASSLKSANYIALRNGKIYVAFGEDGIQVYQLVEKEITL